MALQYSSSSELDSPAPAFSLPGVDGQVYSLDSFKDCKGLLIVFLCNHCPYVIAVHERLSKLAREYASRGVAVIGINSNDPAYREADSFENMKKIAVEWSLPFPYVFDETQDVARAYDAVCTPDPYLYVNDGSGFRLWYRGRVDDSWKDEASVRDQSLRDAIESLLTGQRLGKEMIPSMGCSIKWKELTPKKG
ncbi:MAG: thioredoxin family protein [Bdellovibrionales bacterium]|nr:thioredoxin family protein [Bdellovibrionales bacterium]